MPRRSCKPAPELGARAECSKRASAHIDRALVAVWLLPPESAWAIRGGALRQSALQHGVTVNGQYYRDTGAGGLSTLSRLCTGSDGSTSAGSRNVSETAVFRDRCCSDSEPRRQIQNCVSDWIIRRRTKD